MKHFVNESEEVKDYQNKYKFVYIILSLAATLFVIRLWYLQIIKGSEFRRVSEMNRIKAERIPAPRGMILDRDGSVLVDNRPGFDVTITPQYAGDLEDTAEALSSIVSIPEHTIVKKVKRSRRINGSFRPVHILENLTIDQVAAIERLRIDHPGLDVQMPIVRNYLLGENGAQLFGYVGEISKRELPVLNKGLPIDKKFAQGDIIGKSGLEQTFDTTLRGENGVSFTQVDARGREVTSLEPNILSPFEQSQDSVPGHTIELTIDEYVQKEAYKAFNLTERIGAVVALKPDTGEVIAWVNSPSYDPNQFATRISPKLWSSLLNDPHKPLFNKVIQDHAPPASTFKAIVGLAALQEKIIDINTKHFCPGFLRYGRRPYHCHLRHGHGNVNITQALERSCDVFFYKLGIALGIDKISSYAKALGFGSLTGINLKGEIPGLMPTTQWKKEAIGEAWQPGENLSNAIGQGFVLATPLQVALAFSGIANEGPIYEPQIIRRIVNTDGNAIKEFRPKLIRDVSKENELNVKIDKKNFDIVKKGLWMVANGEHGTARWYKVPGVEMAGKTGTAQLFSLSPDKVFMSCKKRPLEQRHHGWYVGFAPVDNPKIVVSVFSEHSCAGSSGAAPVARDIIRAYYKRYHPDILNQKNPKAAMIKIEENVVSKKRSLFN